MYAHQPVLLTEVLEHLAVRADGVYVDGTFGRGGHARALLDKLGSGGRLLAFDKDPEAVAAAQEAFGGDERFTIRRGSFVMLERTAQELGLAGRIDGVFVDLGVSSPQLDDGSRGFSFNSDGPLDMRMDPDAGLPASQWLDTVDEKQLAHVLREYGEERFAGRIARVILERHRVEPINRTAELADIIASAVPRREPGKHPATRAFQAIRIAVNAELEELDALLEQVPRVLRPGGRFCAIAFHSLEDRRVKRFLRGPVQTEGPRGLPLPPRSGPYLRPLGRAVHPGAAEISANPRARSAVLRTGECVA